MTVEYKGFELKEVRTEDICRYKVIGTYLESLLWPLGDVRIVGSFAKKKAFIHNKDVDVVIHTDIENEDVFVSHMDAIMPLWGDVCSLDIDIFFFGNYRPHFINGSYYSSCNQRRIKYCLKFDKPGRRLWNLWKILAMKYWLSLSK